MLETRRASLHTLADMTWSDNALECGRNAGDVGLDQGGANDACPALFTDLGNDWYLAN